MSFNLPFTLLHSYHTNNEDEILYKNKMLELLQSHPNCFERSCLHAHFTASAWVINQNKTHCVLLHHKKLNNWFQPGGHADGHINLWEVACKEMAEETGITQILNENKIIFDIDIHTIPTHKGVQAHEHYDVRFLFIVPNETTLLQNEESNKLCWVPMADIENYTSEKSILRMVKKCKRF